MSRAQQTYGDHTRAILRLGLPLVGGHLTQFAIGLTDTIMVGWYGVTELAALTLASVFLFTLFLFGSGFGWAIMPMVAAFAASDEDGQIRRATRMALWLSALFFAAVIPLFWMSGALFLWLGQDPEIAALAQTYLRIAGWGLLPGFGVMVLKNYLAGLEHTGVVLWITALGALANALANYALIFGNFGMPSLGVAGAAWASVITNSVMLAGVLVYALRVLPEHALLVRFWRPDWEMFGRVFALGLPIGLTTLAEVTLFAAASVLMGWLGTVPLAAHGIALQITSATFMVHLGLSNAATVRAGNALGRGDAAHLFMGARAVMVLGALAVAASVALFLLVPELLIGAFVAPDDPARDEIIALGTALLVMAALFQLVDAAQVLHLGLLRGLQDTAMPMVMAAVAYWGVGLPLAYLCGFVFGFEGIGVWLGLSLGLAVAALCLGWRFWKRGRGLMGARHSA